MIKKILVALTASATILASNIELAWNPSDGATGYLVYQASSLTGPFVPVAATAGTNQVLSVQPGAYFFYVTAVASNFWGVAESGPSNMASTPPPAAAPSLPTGLLILKVP